MAKSTGSKIYSGVSTFGAIMSDIKAIIGTVFGIIMIIIGIFLENHKTVYSVLGSGTIVDDGGVICTSQLGYDSNNKPYSYIKCSGSCTVVNKNDPTQHVITIPVDFNTNSIVDGKGQYSKGNSITIYVNPNNPADFQLTSDNTTVIGVVLIILGIIMMISSWVWAYFANKYKIVGAYEGVTTGIDYIRGN